MSTKSKMLEKYRAFYVDFQGNLLHVQRSYSHGHLSTPKSGKSRLVDMSDQLRTVLLEHREQLAERFGGQQPSVEIPGVDKNPQVVQFVFPNRKGGPISGDNLRKRVFYALLRETGMRFRFHDIRHTFASLLLAQGESLHYVKEQMGHSSITTTVNVYGYLVPGSNRIAVNRLDDPVEPALRLASGDAG